jgi:site-specific DNA recombinase
MARSTRQNGAAQSPEILRVAAYLRVSTDEQKESGLGIEAQRKRVCAMADVKGWPAPEVYADEGVSGTREPRERPQMTRLLADVRAGKVQAVIVLSLDRLGRRTRIVLDLVESLSAAGVNLVSCKESLDTSTATGAFVLTMFAALAQLERDLIAERTTAARAVLGTTTGDKGGRIPYGYRRIKTPDGLRAAVDPDAAAIVRRIFAWDRHDYSLRQIAEKLQAAHLIAPRGGTCRHSSVAEILKNRELYHGGKRGASEQRWPAILGKKAA